MMNELVNCICVFYCEHVHFSFSYPKMIGGCSFLSKYRHKNDQLWLILDVFSWYCPKYSVRQHKNDRAALGFCTCSRLHVNSKWNIVKSLHEMQTFQQDFQKIWQKLPVFQALGRLYGLRVTNEWRRLRTATLYVDFILSLEIFTKISIQKVSHGHFWAMGFSYFI